MVMENPMQLTMVSAVPFVSDAALCATKVENMGESAITTIPQKKRNTMNKIVLDDDMISGEIRQHIPDKESAITAVFLAPIFSEI